VSRVSTVPCHGHRVSSEYTRGEHSSLPSVILPRVDTACICNCIDTARHKYRARVWLRRCVRDPAVSHEASHALVVSLQYRRSHGGHVDGACRPTTAVPRRTCARRVRGRAAQLRLLLHLQPRSSRRYLGPASRLTSRQASLRPKPRPSCAHRRRSSAATLANAGALHEGVCSRGVLRGLAGVEVRRGGCGRCDRGRAEVKVRGRAEVEPRSSRGRAEVELTARPRGPVGC